MSQFDIKGIGDLFKPFSDTLSKGTSEKKPASPNHGQGIGLASDILKTLGSSGSYSSGKNMRILSNVASGIGGLLGLFI